MDIFHLERIDKSLALLAHDFALILKKLERLTMTVQELETKLDAFIARETKLDVAIKALIAAAANANGGQLTQDVADKVAALDAIFTTAETDATPVTPPAPAPTP